MRTPLLGLVGLVAITLGGCKGKDTKPPAQVPPNGAGPSTTTGSATPPAPAPAPAPSPSALPSAAATKVPVLDDRGIAGLTPAQMSSVDALRAAFPDATISEHAQLTCPTGMARSYSGPDRCTKSGDAPAAAVVSPETPAPRSYQVIDLLGPKGGKHPWSLQVIADGGAPVYLLYYLERGDAPDAAGQPFTLAEAQRWRPEPSCVWAQYPESSAHIECRYRGSKLVASTGGPDPDSLEEAELPKWIAAHGDDAVTALSWGEPLGEHF